MRYGDPTQALGLLVEARRLDPTSKNDIHAIACAYGRSLGLLRWADGWLPRWRNWNGSRRWLIFNLMALALGALMLATQPTSFLPHVLSISFLNLLVLPFTFDACAVVLALMVARRRIGSSWTHLFVQPLVLLVWLPLHFLASVLGYSPAVTLVVLQGLLGYRLVQIAWTTNLSLTEEVACCALILIEIASGIGAVFVLYLGGVWAVIPFAVFAIASFFNDRMIDHVFANALRVGRNE